MTVHTDRMRENLELTHGALFSQRALTALVESGMTRDDAYRVVQQSGAAGLGHRHPFPRPDRRGGPRTSTSTRVFDYGAYLNHLPSSSPASRP